MARPKCLMGNFTNFYGIYKVHQTNVWWTMKVFRLHWQHCNGEWTSCWASGQATTAGPTGLWKFLVIKFVDSIYWNQLLVQLVYQVFGLVRSGLGKLIWIGHQSEWPVAWKVFGTDCSPVRRVFCRPRSDRGFSQWQIRRLTNLVKLRRHEIGCHNDCITLAGLLPRWLEDACQISEGLAKSKAESYSFETSQNLAERCPSA